MRILYTPVLIVPALASEDRAGILEAAGPGAALVEAADPARQRAEIVDADVLFGRVTPEVFALQRRVRYYHSIGAGVDAILSPDLVESDVVLTSEKGEVGIHLAEHAFALTLTKATHHLFTRDLFRRMRPSATLINVTRGAIVYGDDLLVALEQGWLWGAGLDVTDPEPLPPGHPFWTHPRVIVTPHTAGGSPRRAGRVIATFCENLRRLRDGRPLLGLIDKHKGY